jgi:hypothetical protein
MAASVYRAAVLFNNSKHIAAAEKVYTTIGGPTSPSSSSTSSSESESPTPTTSKKRRSHARRAQHHRVPISALHHHNPRADTHITSDGWLTPVVDPHSFHKLGKESAEGQAFVIMMYAARNDWLAKGGQVGSGNGLVATGGSGSAAANVVGVGVVAGSPASVGDGGSTGGEGLNGVGNVGGNSNTTTTTANANGAIQGANLGAGALVVTVFTVLACFV